MTTVEILRACLDLIDVAGRPPRYLLVTEVMDYYGLTDPEEIVSATSNKPRRRGSRREGDVHED